MTARAPLTLPQHPTTARTVWIVAAATAFVLHAAVAAAAYVRMQQDSEAADLGAAGIEIGLELMSPDTPPSDLPVGPNSDASMESVPQVEQKTESAKVDLPKETPVEAENPDRLVAREESKQPAEETPEAKPQEANPAEQSVAHEATAMPSVRNATEAQKSVTVDQGTGDSRRRVFATWHKELVAHLDRYKKYPTDRVQQVAQIVLSLNLDRMGRVVSASVLKSSGDDSFDNAALTMVQRANPVPAPPPLVADAGLSFTLPVNFRAGQRR